jgi:hypothetical protein
MSADLADHLKAAAAAAIEDVMPAVLAEPQKVRLLTIELEVSNGREVRAGTAWIERSVSVARLLGKMPPVPGEQGA